MFLSHHNNIRIRIRIVVDDDDVDDDDKYWKYRYNNNEYWTQAEYEEKLEGAMMKKKKK